MDYKLFWYHSCINKQFLRELIKRTNKTQHQLCVPTKSKVTFNVCLSQKHSSLFSVFLHLLSKYKHYLSDEGDDISKSPKSYNPQIHGKFIWRTNSAFYRFHTIRLNRNARYQEGYLTKSKTLKSCVNKISKLLEAYMYNVRICKSIYYIHILIINLLSYTILSPKNFRIKRVG